MAKIMVADSGSGGVPSSELTATTSQVLNGRTAVTSDSNDESVTGTMPDNSSRTSNGSVPGISTGYSSIPTREGEALQFNTDTDGTNRISLCPPKGYYPGGGSSYVNRPASDFGNAGSPQVLTGYSFTSASGLSIPGTMGTMDKQVITPSSALQKIACAGKYMTGDIAIMAIPSSYVDMSSWTVFRDGAFTKSRYLGIAPYIYEEVPFACINLDSDRDNVVGTLVNYPKIYNRMNSNKISVQFPSMQENGGFAVFDHWIPKGSINKITVSFSMKGSGGNNQTTYYMFVVIITPNVSTTSSSKYGTPYDVYKNYISQGTWKKDETEYNYTKTIDMSAYPYDKFNLGFYGAASGITTTIKEITFSS